MIKDSKSAQNLAWLLDKSIPLPGGIRIGLDGVIGLIPGVGDFATGAISLWIIAQAKQLGVPKTVLARMIFNTFLDFTLGSIPLIGDLFDIAFKANMRNLELLQKHLDKHEQGVQPR
ncbi:DUF4112 domain-containing protein [Teredinibacter turnerae]|uniref:DUF4112 domain-containing protein n=1 Tax=Teredinibacter turnerae TaxID=2426 RepID=UPI00035DAE96|nr:DUF4112 domain-containing protein [Teredinibacter turnerae]